MRKIRQKAFFWGVGFLFFVFVFFGFSFGGTLILSETLALYKSFTCLLTYLLKVI